MFWKQFKRQPKKQKLLRLVTSMFNTKNSRKSTSNSIFSSLPSSQRGSQNSITSSLPSSSSFSLPPSSPSSSIPTSPFPDSRFFRNIDSELNNSVPFEKEAEEENIYDEVETAYSDTYKVNIEPEMFYDYVYEAPQNVSPPPLPQKMAKNRAPARPPVPPKKYLSSL